MKGARINYSRKKMSRDLAYELAEYAANIQYDNLPEKAIEDTKRDLFDCLSTGIAGANAQGIEELIKLAESRGGSKQATTFVFGKKYPAYMTAMINTVMIHGYDYDDSHDVAMMHSGAIVTGTALAAAELVGGCSGEELICALTIGLDIHIRLSLAAKVGIVTSGWVYTPLMGIFGAVAAAGKILKLKSDQMLNAFGIAYGCVSGNYQAITDSAWTKRIQPGFASQSAITACELAKLDVVGAHNIFEGTYGFYHVYLNDQYDSKLVRKGLGKEFLNGTISLKPWPCGRPEQPPIDLAIEARKMYHFDPEQIKHVKIYMNEHLYRAGCLPKEIRNRPSNVVQGQFSIPYGVACGLVNGKVGLQDYTKEGLERKDVLTMCAKIEGVIDSELEKKYHARVCPVYLEIEMEDGSILKHSIRHTLGSVEKPMTEQNIAEKMDDCIAFCKEKMPLDTAHKIRKMVNTLETISDCRKLVEAMVADK